MKYIMITLSTILLLTSAENVVAADAVAGKEKSVSCAGCHGIDGISQAKMFPNLAGQNDEYLEVAMKAYREGERENDMMTPMARGLKDEDIADLAAYFSSLKGK